MNQDISKLCADSLRNSLKDKYGIKLKATHAHHLVAAFFGYRSKTALKAEEKFPIENLHEAEVVVMVPSEVIDARRITLKDLPDNLPDSYKLGQLIYEALLGSDQRVCQMPPFRSFQSLAKYVVENNDAFKSLYRFTSHIPMHHMVKVEMLEGNAMITVFHTYESVSEESKVYGKMEMRLSRVSGHIGFSNLEVSAPVKFSAEAVKTLKELGITE